VVGGFLTCPVPVSSARKTTRLTAAAIRRFYPDTPTDLGHFSSMVHGALGEQSLVLEVGAGRGVVTGLDWRAEKRRIIGVDLDPRVSSHPFLDEAVRGDVFSLPFPGGTFDAAVSVFLMEHLADPLGALKEIYRVLKPGGIYLAKTPNKNHYVGWMARLTPDAFHKWYNARRGRSPEDTFSTFYRFNRFEDVVQISREAGFEVIGLEGFEGVPEYLLLSMLLFVPGLFYERWTNRKPERKRWRASLEVVLQKPLAA
jgi:SAM-dependent methyltransferase